MIFFLLQLQIQNMNKEEIPLSTESQLLQLGFNEDYIKVALKITNDIQVASQIILKLEEQGPNADLSSFQDQKEITIEQLDLYDKNYGKNLSRPKLLFIVNGQLKMGKGKVCAQVGHAVIGSYLQIQQQSRFDNRSKIRLQSWQYSGQPKIVVKCETFNEMKKIRKEIEDLKININMYFVEDAGHTQIKAGSRTVLAIGPAFSEEIDSITHHLKLL